MSRVTGFRRLKQLDGERAYSRRPKEYDVARFDVTVLGPSSLYTASDRAGFRNYSHREYRGVRLTLETEKGDVTIEVTGDLLKTLARCFRDIPELLDEASPTGEEP